MMQRLWSLRKACVRLSATSLHVLRTSTLFDFSFYAGEQQLLIMKFYNWKLEFEFAVFTEERAQIFLQRLLFVCLSLCPTVLHSKQACAFETVPGSLAEYFIVSLRCLGDEKMHTEVRTQTHARAHTVSDAPWNINSLKVSPSPAPPGETEETHRPECVIIDILMS